MAKLIIPMSVGGTDPDITPQGQAQAVKVDTNALKIPISVGGTYDVDQMTQPGNMGGMQQQGGAMAQQYQQQMPEQRAPTWAEIRDPFTGELRETEESRSLPEATPISMTSYTKGLKDVQSIAGMLLAADDEGRKTIIKSLIPDAKIEPDEKGNDIITYPDGRREILNRPGFSRADAIQLAFDAALFLPGGLAAAPIKGAIKKGVVGAIGAGLTEAGRQQASGAVGTGEKTDLGRVALAAGAGGLAEAVPAVIAGKGRAAKKLGVLETETRGLKGAIEEGLEASEELGVDLFPAQITKAPSAARRQAVLQKLDGSSQKALEAIKKQDEQYGRAVEDVLTDIAPSKTIDEAPLMIKEAAEKAVNRKLAARKKAAEKWYQKAFQNEKNVVTPKAYDTIEKLRKNFKPDSAGQKFLNELEGKLGSGNIRQQHGTKKEFDAMFDRFSGDKALDNQQKAILTQVKQAFLEDLKKANSNYDKARRIFSSESPEVDRINKSYIGKISQMEKFDSDKLDAIVPKLFKPRTTDTQVRQFRKILKKENPYAWNAIVRRRFEDLLSKGGYDNPEKVYTALFKNNANKKQLYAAMDKEQAKRLKYLEVTTERANIGRFRGTDTATKMEDVKGIDGGGLIGRTVKAATSPFDTVGNFMQGVGTELRRDAWADVMFNPKWDPDWKALRKLTPNTAGANSKLNSMLKKSAKAIKYAAVSQSPESPAATRKALEILNKED